MITSHALSRSVLNVTTAAMCVLWLVCCGSGVQSPTLSEIVDRNSDLQRDRKVERSELKGDATWYGDKFHGRPTANGEDYDMDDFTAAHRTLPFNTVVRVIDQNTLQSVVVRINDRGPFNKRRIIDLSRAAAQDIGLVRRGVTRVALEILVWGDGQTHHHKRR